MKRVVWHDREPWFYTYTEGGFEGYIALFSRRRLAPDLPRYAFSVSISGVESYIRWRNR